MPTFIDPERYEGVQTIVHKGNLESAGIGLCGDSGETTHELTFVNCPSCLQLINEG